MAFGTYMVWGLISAYVQGTDQEAVLMLGLSPPVCVWRGRDKKMAGGPIEAMGEVRLQ